LEITWNDDRYDRDVYNTLSVVAAAEYTMNVYSCCSQLIAYTYVDFNFSCSGRHDSGQENVNTLQQLQSDR